MGGVILVIHKKKKKKNIIFVIIIVTDYGWLLLLYRFIIFSPSLIVYRANNCGKKCGNLYGQRIFIITIQGLG